MQCPRCQTLLQEVTKTGVLIDLCPECRGVWLDRGELEKIIQRAREVEREWEEEQMRWERRRYDDDDRYEWRSGKSGWPRKKRWTEIFDIFD
ncbi:MAG: zf-TFIIB domain-containing protein [Candidatus Binatia bacterium]|nr:zf-TFIIB domain-containing protein [Candidatus Binatia bacterium]